MDWKEYLTEAKNSHKIFAKKTGKKIEDYEEYKGYYIVQLKGDTPVYIVDKKGDSIYDVKEWNDAYSWIDRNGK